MIGAKERGRTVEFVVTVDGAPLTPQVDGALDTVEIDEHDDLPSACTLTFHDPLLQVTSGARLALGRKLEVSIRLEGTVTKAFTGEVASLRVLRSPSGLTTTVVRAYDPLHRLQRGRVTRTFQNVTAAEIARTVLTGQGVLLGLIGRTPAVHSHVSQVDESDWSFLRRLADDIGFVLRARDGKAEFVAPKRPMAADVTATLDTNIVRLDVEVADDEAVVAVEVRSWDDKGKKAVVGTAATASAALTTGVEPARPPTTAPAKKFVAAGQRFEVPADATNAAKSLAASLADVRGEVVVVLHGDPAARPGATLELQRIGVPYDGRYVIAAARHTWSPAEGYQVEVVAGSRRDRTLLGTLGTADAAGRDVRRVHGVWPGIVTQVRDPENLGRVRLRFPWLDDTYESWWARVAMPGAGKLRGVVWFPEVNDEVLVAFSDGLLERPVVIGGLFNRQDTSPGVAGRFDTTGKVNRRTLQSRTGHLLEMVDDLAMPSVQLASGDKKFELLYNGSSGQLLVRCAGTGGVTVESAGPLSLHGKSVTVRSDSTLALQATGDVSVRGAFVRLN